MENPSLSSPDRRLETKLRPKNLLEFIGNKQVVQRLRVMISAAKQRGEPLGHILFHGPPGIGKTTLSSLLAEEMGATFHTSSGPCIEKAGDLAGLLTNLEEHSIFFIDEIHRLQKNVEEYLYSAMEDFFLDLMIDSGPHARSVSVKLNPFTLIGATTKTGNISPPLRSRFLIALRLQYYDDISLSKIVERSGKRLKVNIDTKGAYEIAKRSRGIPRIANNILRWVRDFAQLHNKNIIDEKIVYDACKMIAIDEKGLDDMDKKILQTIVENYQGGPVGISSIAAAIGEEEKNIAETETYLIRKGFLIRTPRGREATQLTYKYLEDSP